MQEQFAEDAGQACSNSSMQTAKECASEAAASHQVLLQKVSGNAWHLMVLL